MYVIDTLTIVGFWHAITPSLNRCQRMNDDGNIYVCQSCFHEDDSDRFGTYCPNCGVNLDELEHEYPADNDPGAA